MSEEIRPLIDQIGKAVDELKTENQKKFDEIEKQGSTTAEQEAKVDTMADDVASLLAKAQDIELKQKSFEEAEKRIEQLESVLARPETGNTAKDVDMHTKAFSNYLRVGKDNMEEVEKKALYESDDTLGGFYAPTEYVTELIKTVTEISPIRSIARVMSTSNRGVEIPKRTGQFSATFVNENATRSETTGYTTGLLEIPTHELYARVDISQAMLEDSAFDLESEMSDEFSTQFAKAEGTAFVSGDSIGQPLGFTDSTAGVGSTNSGSGTALTANGLLDLMYAIKPDYMNNATFVFNRSTLAAILKLEDTEGQKIFVNNMNYVGGAPATILGKPYVLAEDMPNVAGSAKPIAYGDFSRAYRIVDRVNISILRDPFSSATSGQIRYIARKRVGGAVVLPEAIRLQNISA